MKNLFKIVFILLFISGCAYNYHIGVKESSEISNVAVIKFNNRIKVTEIDDEEFPFKSSIWVDGWHTVYLPPGKHSFTFRYDAVSQLGGYYTRDFVTLSKHLDAGKHYEIVYKHKGSKIFFSIEEKVDKDMEKIKESSKDNKCAGKQNQDSCYKRMSVDYPD